MEERKWKESKESKGSWKGGRRKEEGGRKEGKTMPVFGYELVMLYNPFNNVYRFYSITFTRS